MVGHVIRGSRSYGSRPGRLLIVVLVALLVAAPAAAQTDAPTGTTPPAPEPGAQPAPATIACDQLDDRTLTVATKPVEPFVFVDGTDAPRGFSIELWQLIAARLGTQSTYVEHETVQQVLDETAGGGADLGIAAISITADRQEQLDFSTPFFTGGLRLLVREKEASSFGDSVWTLVDSWLVRVALGFFLLVLVAGTVVWLIERRHNEDFPHGLAGIGEGMWWAIVTMATVGYGDRVTRTGWGRLFSALWILLGLVLVAQFTATIAARLTVEQLTATATSLDQLADDRVVTVRDTAAAKALEHAGVPVQEVGSIDEMVDAVASGEADAAVYDSAILEYQATQDTRLHVVGKPFTLDYYGIAFPTGSPLRECVDRALLDVVEDGSWQRLHDAWFG